MSCDQRLNYYNGIIYEYIYVRPGLYWPDGTPDEVAFQAPGVVRKLKRATRAAGALGAENAKTARLREDLASSASTRGISAGHQARAAADAARSGALFLLVKKMVPFDHKYCMTEYFTMLPCVENNFIMFSYD